MSASILCFYSGYFLRKKSLKWHRISNLSGVFFNLTAAVYLLSMKYLFGGLEEHSVFSAAPQYIIHIHRFWAAVALVMMLVMAYSGIKRKRKLHVKLHFVFLPLYTLVYASGLFLFQSYPVR
ncbi:hypothetical protein [Leptospira idonii]